jgi:hypothetical protein
VVTAVFGVLALNDKSTLEHSCSSGRSDCPPGAQSSIDGLHTNSIASDVGLGVAVLGLLAGGGLLLFGRGSVSPSSAQATAQPPAPSLEPWIAAQLLGLRGRF